MIGVRALIAEPCWCGSSCAPPVIPVVRRVPPTFARAGATVAVAATAAAVGAEPVGAAAGAAVPLGPAGAPAQPAIPRPRRPAPLLRTRRRESRRPARGGG